MQDFSNYKFRCSQLGDIIPKSGKLTQTAKSKLIEIYVSETYGVFKEITSKQIEKGNRMESYSIALIDKLFYGGIFLAKEKERKTNDYISGECDLITPDGIIWDIKNSYDIFTFNNAELSYEYMMQLQGYMWLYGAKKARLCYTLNDLPFDMLDDEFRRLFYTGKYLSIESPNYLADCEKLSKKFIYDYLQPYERVKIFDMDIDMDIQDRIKQGTDEARLYLRTLQDVNISQTNKIKSLLCE